MFSLLRAAGLPDRLRRVGYQAIIILQVGLLSLPWQMATANPTGGNVVAGSATIGQSGSTLTINQLSDRAVINWQDFSIQPGETTRFVQPNSNSAILNRVTGGNPSAILGTLEANGNVYLLNPNGILVGPGASVNVNGLVASTLNLNDAMFMQGGDLTFEGTSRATVKNFGTIRAIEGNIYLIGASVENHGTLQASHGTVGLAAGQSVQLVDSAHPSLVVRATSDSIGGTGIHNTGIIDAVQAELFANGGNVYALAINNEGVIRATGSEERGGRIYLVADGGHINSSGDLVAKKGANGGDVIVHAGGQEGSSAVLSGNIDVSGTENGGIVFVKGGVIDVSDAKFDLSGTAPGQFVLSLGPHSVEFGPGTAGPFINWNVPSSMSLESGGLEVSSTTQTLDGSGNVIREDANSDPFVDLMIEPADTSDPFIQSISFNLDREGNGPMITADTDVLYAFEVREPDGTIVTQYLVLDATTFANTRVSFTATGGELIQKITINSNQDGYTFDPMDPFTAPTPNGIPTPVMNSLKQISDNVEFNTANILIVQKQTNPDGSPVIFDFELEHNPSMALLYSFGLADGQEFAVALSPDTYDVTEIVPIGWFLTDIDSSIVDSSTMTMVNIDSTVTTDLPNATASVDLASNETVTLVFTNTQGAQIKVTKEVLAGDVNLPFVFDASYDANGFSLADGEMDTSIYLLPGEYAVTENLPIGWFFDGVVSSDPGSTAVVGTTATVQLEAGQLLELTFQNTQGAQIKVTKEVLAGDVNLPFDFDASYDANGFSLADGEMDTSIYLRPGEYSVTENLPIGWFFDGVVSSDPGSTGVIGTTATVQLEAGQLLELTFQNTQGAQIKVTKEVLAGDINLPFDFDASYDANGFSLADGEMDTSIYLRPGEYAVTENLPIGWFFDGVVSSDLGSTGVIGTTATVQLEAGQLLELTFQNRQDTVRVEPIFFKWDPIYPDGIGYGWMRYGYTEREEGEEIAGASSASIFSAN